jgi:hypothetical protein
MSVCMQWRCYAGIPFTELARLAAIAVAFETMQVNETADVEHALSVRMFLCLEDDNLNNRTNHENSRGGECFD